MAKFCILTGKVTNCTENCKFCIEEETNDRNIEVGDRVRYISENNEPNEELGFYPPKGNHWGRRQN